MLLTGIDLCEVERMKKAIARPSFYNSVFGDIEKARLEGLSGERKYQSAAAFFAAKEAFSKAFEGILSPNTLRDVQVAHKQNGKPYFVLSGEAWEVAKNKQMDLSITHTSKLAQAIVVVLEDK